MQQIAAFSNGQGGYSAGKQNRLTANWSRTTLTENQITRGQLDQLRATSWDLWRNNPYVRKIVRTLETKVIGRGLHPQPLVKTIDGQPHTAFRKRARELWWAFAKSCDVRGLPGRGGLDLVEMQKLALRSTILSGNVLTRLVMYPKAKNGNPVPMALHAIDAQRLSRDTKGDGFAEGNQFYRGVELDEHGARVAYHIETRIIDELQTQTNKVTRVGASEIVHLYAQDDVDQVLGVPWFAPAIFQLKDTGDLQYNVMKSAAVMSCFTVGYRLGTGQTKLGLNGTQNDASQLVDDDGNRISRVQPGMLINLGQGGDLQAVNPSQPATNLESFIQHLLRGTGAALPGVKASTVTGDYRNASYSSERSADNDCWPEMESVQDWFAAAWCQPVYEQVVRQGMLSGWFVGVVSAEEFEARERDYLDTAWQGPVPRSINPTDDQSAAKLRIANGNSSPQIECGAMGRDPSDVIRDLSEWVAMCQAAGLPDWYIATSLGQTKQPVDPSQHVDQSQQGAAADAQQAN